MAISGAVQTLTAAFSFGILLQAALGALFIFVRRNEGTLFSDGRRLALILFVLFAALWAQIDFLNLLLTSTSTSLCQVSLLFSTTADQLARVSAEQFLLWSVGHGTKVTLERMVLQGVLVLRLAAGGVLAGFTRPDFAPVCVAKTTLMPASIAVLSSDFLIIGVLLVRAAALGIFREMREDKSMARREQSKGLVMSIIAMAAWTGTSTFMILGMPSVELLLRTLLPAGGLFILIVVVVNFSGSLILPVDAIEITTPEAHSPFVAPTAASREIMRGNVGDGSPMMNPNFAMNRSLFITNPSSTPRDSPRSFQGNQVSTPRGFTRIAGDITRDMGVSETPIAPPEVPFNPSLIPGTSTIAPRATREPIEISGQQVSVFSPTQPKQKEKKSMFARGKLAGKPPTVQGFTISHPHMTSSVALSGQPIPKMNTIDLATAVVNERERREGAAARARLVANRPPPPPPAISAEQAGARMASIRRKEISKPVRDALAFIPSSSASGLSTETVNGSTTSASLSPGRDDLRRRSPRSIPIAESEPAMKPTLTKKTTIGLPSNPRARTTTFPVALVSQEQRVMLLNDVAYDNPEVVKTIIKKVTDVAGRSDGKGVSSPGSHTTEPQTSHSVVHRPRPVKKETDHDRGLFSTEPSPRHRRSRSHSSVVSRKTILDMPQGSPNALPPLPPPPATATRVGRILPNDTKSMTFHEKVELLFPTPPSTSYANHRRSSVPSIPSRSVIDQASPTEQAERDHNRESSERASTYMFGELNNDVLSPEPRKGTKKNAKRQSYWFGKNSRQSGADEAESNRIPSIHSRNASLSRQLEDKSLPPSPKASLRKSAITMATSNNDSDDSISLWGSLHSEVPPVDISKAMLKARETIIQRRGQTPVESSRPSVPPKNEISMGDRDAVTDSEENRRSALEPHDRRQSFFIDIESPSVQSSTHDVPSWHRRIGDELPSFSERKTKPQLRKMPPPAPLLLGKHGRQATVVVRNPEPSPLESPENAIRELEEQLGKLDKSNRGSVGSLLRRMPDAETDSRGNAEGLALLDNLELEMGQQESVWQQMQTNMDRDSMSVTMSPVRTESESITREPSQSSSKRAARSVSRRARIRSSMTVRSKGDDSGSTPSTESSDNSRASAWQQRLAGAQIEYLENAPALLQNRNLNFLTKSKARFQNITPPDSDHSLDSSTDVETESESESECLEAERLQNFKATKPSLLWRSIIPVFEPATRALWIQSSSTTRGSSLEPAAKNLRLTPRVANGTLSISSVLLWTKPLSAPKNRSGKLWTSKKSRPKSIVTRPVTQRPQRKSRRQTFLPDIVESPVPVPNKRETLGIFQFPWGELSDQPVYQPTFDLSRLTGAMLNPKHDARSRELEPEINDYESSFFDDYDDDQSEEEEYDESDDDFDETTLWEIASLLKSNDVPSRESMFPGKEIIEDYDDSEGSDSEAQQYFSRIEIAPLGNSSTKAPQLWSGAFANTPVNFGLAQPNTRVWSAFVASATPDFTLKQRAREDLAVLKTCSLWTARSQPIAKPSSGMWAMKLTGPSLWTPAPKVDEIMSSGLFSVIALRTDYRTTAMQPAAINILRKSCTTQASLGQLTSHELWSGPDDQFIEHHWISESSIRPESPSVYSPSSSGRSSPDYSDASSAISMSSKASSLWSAVGTTTWWEQRNAQKAAGNDSKRPITPVKNASHPSKAPFRQQGTPLQSVRESRVLASRVLWEQVVPTLDPKPVKKYGKLVASNEPAQPVHKPLRQQYRPTVAYPGDWKAALAEAIAAGKSQKRLIRPVASSANWEAALHEAVSCSQPRLQRPAYSPRAWEAALAEAVFSSKSTNGVIRARKFDSAVMHPVFFTSSLFTTVQDIHPAAIGYVTKPSVGLWKSTSRLAASSGKGPMWRKSAAFDRALPTQAELLDGHVRTAPVVKGVELPRLESKAMWQAAQSSSFIQNWLSTSMKSTPAGMWAAPIQVPKQISISPLWTANAETNPMFPNPHTEAWKQTKRAERGVVELETRSLWRPSFELPPSPKHWLKKREVRGVVFRY